MDDLGGGGGGDGGGMAIKITLTICLLTTLPCLAGDYD